MLKDFIDGFNCAVSGFTLIRQRGIKRFVAIPLFINVSLFIAAFWFGIDKISQLIAWMLTYLPTWLEWLSVILWLLFGIVAMLVIFYTFTLIANFIGAPFNSTLSEKLESQLTKGIPPSTGKKSTLINIKESILAELQKFAYLIMWVVPLFALTFVPVVQLIMPFVWFIFGAWMMSIEYLDYPMGNHEITFSQQRKQLRKKRALTLGYGSFIMFITTIPIINFLAMPIAVTGATQLWVKHLSKP